MTHLATRKAIKIITGLLPVFFLACGPSKKATTNDTVIIIEADSAKRKTPDPLQLRWGAKLGVPPESIKNIRLYKFIDEWMNTPYLWGGTTKKGIDCSAFMQKLLAEVYNLQIPRTSNDQFFAELTDRFKKIQYAYEGDLVFFKTIPGPPITHVGLYLYNNKFINSSSSKGVSIADLNDPYWKSCYVASGRIKNSAPAKTAK
jgi:lipoprotein Spr